MFITREIDYGFRVVRALHRKGQCTAAEISELEGVPTAFAYKILKKLQNVEIVEIIRGKSGGYHLRQSPDTLTLHDIVKAIGDENTITACLTPGYVCTSNEKGRCHVHSELLRIQAVLEAELKRKTLTEVFNS